MESLDIGTNNVSFIFRSTSFISRTKWRSLSEVLCYIRELVAHFTHGNAAKHDKYVGRKPDSPQCWVWLEFVSPKQGQGNIGISDNSTHGFFWLVGTAIHIMMASVIFNQAEPTSLSTKLDWFGTHVFKIHNQNCHSKCTFGDLIGYFRVIKLIKRTEYTWL